MVEPAEERPGDTLAQEKETTSMGVNPEEEILKFAIDSEQEAYEFYTEMAERAQRPEAREFFKRAACEEQAHKAKLEAVQRGNLLLSAGEKIEELDVTDYLISDEASPGMTYQEALILAMKKEKAAFRLYSDIAETATDPRIKELLLSLAQEEAKHKLRFEIEYDEATRAGQ
jgi:rubrerythrin